MSAFIRFFFLLFSLFFLAACSQKNTSEFSLCFPGCQKKLLAFSSEDSSAKTKGYAWISATFNTQDDSVFYDSCNDLRDRFFINMDANRPGMFARAVQTLCHGDSAVFLLEVRQFFQDQFNSDIPIFIAGDTIVKVYVKVKQVLSDNEFLSVSRSFENKEMQEISTFLGSEEAAQNAKDPAGFFWVEKPDSIGLYAYAPGEVISLSYSGGFLNGRIIDRAEDFSFVIGTPDQILKGLNYVIPKLKKGQTSKIILPSHLAFGESGSSNGSVPPFTPMLYKLSIN